MRLLDAGPRGWQIHFLIRPITVRDEQIRSDNVGISVSKLKTVIKILKAEGLCKGMETVSKDWGVPQSALQLQQLGHVHDDAKALTASANSSCTSFVHALSSVFLFSVAAWTNSFLYSSFLRLEYVETSFKMSRKMSCRCELGRAMPLSC